jgi:MFS family permease
MVAFLMMTGAYIAVGTFTNFWVFVSFMVVLGLGGGLFKPVISGTIARSTDESNSTVGFGIYYWSINVGSFIASLVTAHFVKIDNVFPVFALSAAYVGLMFFNNLFFYREPKKPEKVKTWGETWFAIVTVCKNWRFILLLLIFSGFWGMYDRSTDSALWLLEQNYIDMTPVNEFVTGFFSALEIPYEFEFTVANIMTINAGVIILFQVLVSYLVRKTPPVPTMIVGIGLATLFPLLVAVSNNPWVFILGLVIFSIGEITAYPKLISYVGLIAPKDKVAVYMGFVFLPIFFSALIYSYPNGLLWENLVIEGGQIQAYWYIVAGLGAATALGLLLYHIFIGKKLEISE